MFDKYQSLRDTLTAMELPQLQQYTAMHKDDPYVVTLALSIANQKNKAKIAQQGLGGMQPMPKVVDEDIAGMAQPMPENTGIGQLPAQNLQGMAGGGIVAFDEGGEVPRYQSQGLVKPSPFAYGRGDVGGWSLADLFGGFRSGAGAGRGKVSPELVQVLPDYDEDLAPGMEMGAARPLTTAPAAPGVDAGTKPPAPQPRPAAPQAGLPALATTPADIQKMLAAAQQGQSMALPQEVTGGITDLQKAEQAAADANVAGIRAEQAARGPALKEYEKQLMEKSARTEKAEASLLPMTLIETGMAIMAGTSPYAAANIGAGAQIGIASYKKGADKLEEARDKMAEGLAKIEEVRRNESRMDSKELREAENAAKKPLIDAKKLMLSAYEKNWGLNRADATKGVELAMLNQRTMYEQAEQTKRTQMQLGAPSGIEKLVDRMQRDPDFAKAYKEYASISPEVKGDAAILAKYATSDGQMALKMMEASQDPQERALAASIKARLQASMLQPSSTPTGPVRP